MATTVLLPLLTFKFLYKSVKDTFILLFILNFVLSGITELILTFFHFSRLNSMFIVNIFCLTQFIVLSIALLKSLPLSSSKYNTISVILIFVVVAFAIIRYVVFISFTELDSISTPIESIILFILSGINLTYLTKNSEVLLLKNYKFWFMAGCFLCFCISTVILSTGSLLFENKVTLVTYTWVINSFLTIGTNIMYFIGILCLPQKKN